MKNGRRINKDVQICTLLEASTNLEALSRLDQVREPRLGIANEYGNRDGHASLPSSYVFALNLGLADSITGKCLPPKAAPIRELIAWFLFAAPQMKTQHKLHDPGNRKLNIPSGMTVAWFLAPIFDCTRLPFCVPLESTRTARTNIQTFGNDTNPPVIDMLPSAIAANKANCSDGRMVTNGVYGRDSAVDDVDDAIGKASALTQFGDDHGRTRVTL